MVSHTLFYLRRYFGQVVITIVLLIGGLMIVAPIWWMFASSFRSIMDTFGAAKPQWWITNFEFSNYIAVLNRVPILRFMANSFKISSIVVLCQMITSSMAAYAFGRLRFPGKQGLLAVMLSPLMIPPQVTIIPLFIILRNLGWIDTHKALIVPLLSSAFGIFLIRQYFMSIPVELEDAARVDGANEFQIFLLVMLPLIKPGLVSFGIFNFMYYWNDYFRPLIFLNTLDKMTVPLGMSLLKGYLGMGSLAWVMAGVSVAVIPVIIVFLFAQRYFVEGITMTGLKEG